MAYNFSSHHANINKPNLKKIYRNNDIKSVPINSDYEEIDYSNYADDNGVVSLVNKVKEQAINNQNIVLDDASNVVNVAEANLSLLFGNDDSNKLSSEEKEWFSNVITNVYPSFKEMLTNNIQQLGIIESFVPQGVCSANEYTLVSLYDSSKEKDSSVLIIDPNGEKRWVPLDLPKGTHVGGIAYDPINNNIWIAGASGEIGVYNYDDIINNNGDVVSAIKSFDVGLKNEEGKSVASYLTYYNGSVYVGNFVQQTTMSKVADFLLADYIYEPDPNPGTLKEFKIGTDGISLEKIDSISLPTKVQGVSFYEKDNKKYLAVSRSYGRDKKSELRIYEYNDGKYDKLKSFTMPTMLEQITFNNDGSLKCVFESYADKYHVDDDVNGIVTEIPAVCSIDIFNHLN